MTNTDPLSAATRQGKKVNALKQQLEVETDKLRQLVLDASDDGHSNYTIAKLAGQPQITVGRWLKTAGASRYVTERADGRLLVTKRDPHTGEQLETIVDDRDAARAWLEGDR